MRRAILCSVVGLMFGACGQGQMKEGGGAGSVGAGSADQAGAAQDVSGGSGRRAVVPHDERYANYTYGEWSVKFWQWALPMPQSKSPVAGTADCSLNQSGPVWFLSGNDMTLADPPATRSCTVPAGTALFLAIGETDCDSNPDSATTPAFPKDVKVESAYHDCAAYYIPAATATAELDGVPIPDVTSYRTQSPLFAAIYPPENMFGQTAGIFPAASDGFFLLFKPMSRGHHTLHYITHDGPSNPDFKVDLTYQLTVQ